MKRYKFRLEQVRKVRAIELDRAIAAVAQAQFEVAAARQRTRDGEDLYRTIRDEQPVSTDIRHGGHGEAGGLDVLKAWVERCYLAADAIMAARAAEQVAEGHLQAMLQAWVLADQKVRLLDELDARSRERHLAEVLADEQRALDDLVTSRVTALSGGRS